MWKAHEGLFRISNPCGTRTSIVSITVLLPFKLQELNLMCIVCLIAGFEQLVVYFDIPFLFS